MNAAEKQEKRNWRKCPLCYNPIFLKYLKPALVRRHEQVLEQEEVEFHLMCRERGNTVVIDLTYEQIHSHE